MGREQCLSPAIDLEAEVALRQPCPHLAPLSTPQVPDSRWFFGFRAILVPVL